MSERRWSIDKVGRKAVGVSASRRTDIPALFARWFENRFREGFAEYVPAGPARRVRRSLRPEDVTHFNFWTKWPRPFFRALDAVLEAGYPVLWNVTVSGLGGTAVEPNVPVAERAVAAVRELSTMVPPAAILWRYDPVFVSRRFDAGHHLQTFRRLVGLLAGRVDRVALSFVHPYARRVVPDLEAYARETGDAQVLPSLSEQLELLGRLQEVATAAALPLTTCCAPALRARLGCERAACNAWSWACRVYPVLERHRRLGDRPTREDCACSEEVDIGVYDTCVLGCRYSYGSCNEARARRAFAQHDPDSPCLIP